MKLIHETNVPEKEVPGRFLRWVSSPGVGLDAEFLSCCIMRVAPGETVRPAHSHPEGEELLYFVHGEGKVYVDGEIRPVRAGSLVLFTKGCKHQVRNSGKEELKVICFFAPRTDLSEYVFHEDVDFDSGTEYPE
ncbi:MAG: cupin domain-containing protein [Oscillospiraceae bacterium]|nr:cupin domain-containing protein [Oscillospiraceae bacterium]